MPVSVSDSVEVLACLGRLRLESYSESHFTPLSVMLMAIIIERGEREHLVLSCPAKGSSIPQWQRNGLIIIRT